MNLADFHQVITPSQKLFERSSCGMIELGQRSTTPQQEAGKLAGILEICLAAARREICPMV